MAKRQREWNRHEAAVLLNALLAVRNGITPRMEAIARVSEQLRRMAQNQGEEIDERFRNVNGIGFEMKSMESALVGRTVVKPASRLFEQIVELYRTNNPEYKKLLEEARAMTSDKQSCETEFMTWLSEKVSAAQLSELYWCYAEIENAGKGGKVLRKPLFETTEYGTVRKLQQYLEGRQFRKIHPRDYAKIVAAGRYYTEYIRQMTLQKVAATLNGPEQNSAGTAQSNTGAKVVAKPQYFAPTAQQKAPNTPQVTPQPAPRVTVEETPQETPQAARRQTAPVTSSQAAPAQGRPAAVTPKPAAVPEPGIRARLKSILEAQSKIHQFGLTPEYLMRQTGCKSPAQLRDLMAKLDCAEYRHGRYYYVANPSQNAANTSAQPAAQAAPQTTISAQPANKPAEQPQNAANTITQPAPQATNTATNSAGQTVLTRTAEDERLLKKYPIIYKKVYRLLLVASPGTRFTVSTVQTMTHNIARMADILDILQNASWVRMAGDCYVYSDEIVVRNYVPEPETEEKAPANINAQLQKDEPQLQVKALAGSTAPVQDMAGVDCLTIDFNNLVNFAFTKPEYFTYFGERINQCTAWADIYVALIAKLVGSYPNKFKPGMSFTNDKWKPDLVYWSDRSSLLGSKTVPGTGYVVEVKINATNIVRRIKYLLDLCGVEYKNVVIKYRYKDANSERPGSHNSSYEQLTIEAISSTPAAPPAVVNKDTFYDYLVNVQGLAASTARVYSSAIGTCEKYAREHRNTHWRLYTSDQAEVRATVGELFSRQDFIEYNLQWHNQPRAAITKLLAFIGGEPASANGQPGHASRPSQSANRTPKGTIAYREPYHNPAYERVLQQSFKRGFRLDSTLEIGRFRVFYEAINGTELTAPDAMIEDNIKRLCVRCKDVCYLEQNMLSEELKAKLLKYINDSFDSGKTAIYYKAICTEFAEDFLDYPLHDNTEALKEYLTAIGNAQFYIGRSSISRDPYAAADPLDELRICMQEFARPVKYEEIYEALAHLPQQKIKQMLTSNAEFINNGRGEYFHISALQLTDEGLEDIAQIIQQAIDESGFIAGNELYDAIQAKYPYIIEENAAFKDYGFRDALKYKLGDRFSFNGNIISKAGQELSMHDVFADFARSHQSFTIDELQSLAEALHSTIYFGAVYANSLRISQRQFVAKDSARFDVEATDAALDKICTGEFIPVQRVDNLYVLPDAGYPWNSFLLEHYVANYSKKYKHVNAASFNATQANSAIVKRTADIEEFDDLVVALLCQADVELKREPVLQLLVDEGLLAVRRYSNIEAVITRAKAQKNRKGAD